MIWRPLCRMKVPCGAEVSLGLIVATSNAGFASAGMGGSGAGADWAERAVAKCETSRTVRTAENSGLRRKFLALSIICEKQICTFKESHRLQQNLSAAAASSKSFEVMPPASWVTRARRTLL